MNNYLGFDIGGTKSAVVLAKVDEETQNFEIVKKVKIKTEGTWQEVLTILIEKAKEICTLSEVKAAGVSIGGPLDTKTGYVLSPPNLPGWDNVPITSFISSALSIPCYLQNDANASALAEWQFGSGKGYNNVIFLTFGTGFGAGLILNGKLYEGAKGMAGEIGHVRLTQTGPIGYRKRGSVEGYCSGGGIKQLGELYVKKAIKKGIPSSLIGIELNAKVIAEEAVKGDALALEIYSKAGEKLGCAISILTDLFDPDLIIIGSIYTRSEKLLKDAMEKKVKIEALSTCPVMISTLGEQIGDVAAITVAMNRG